MFRNILMLTVFIHGLIHIMGFAKAYNYGNITQLTKEISKTSGTIWLIAAMLFIAVTVMLFLKKDSWWILGLIAVIISQILIFNVWEDAKFGTIANVIILIAIILGYGSSSFENSYKKDVSDGVTRTQNLKNTVLTESDIKPLPVLVRQYIRYTGALDKPKLLRAKVVFEGEMRDKGKDWFKFRSEQYNFFDEPTRLFFMKAKMFGMTVPGYHAYKKGIATMQIKLFGLYPIVDAKGKEMNKAETVTLFNDMCIFAPAALIDKRITWAVVDSSSVKATFTNQGNTISAILYFNDIGQLVNFVSDDRYVISDMKQYRFSTPVSGYKNMNGYNVPTYGETIWHYPDGAFCYGKFYLKEIEFNGEQFGNGYAKSEMQSMMKINE
jgi:hypothetical protein